jgi:hypothetical protein
MESGPGLTPILVTIVIVAVAIGGFIVYNEMMEPDMNNGEITVQVSIDFGNGTVLSDTIATNNSTALGILEEMVGYDNLDVSYGTSGAFINGINGVCNGAVVPGLNDTDQRWWLWYVNGTMPMEAVDHFIAQEGDNVEFKFELSPWR